MRDDPRPVNDRDLFEDRNALTGDEPGGELLGPIDTFRHRARYLALLLGFSEASRRYLARHPGLRWLRRAVYFVSSICCSLPPSTPSVRTSAATPCPRGPRTASARRCWPRSSPCSPPN